MEMTTNEVSNKRKEPGEDEARVRRRVKRWLTGNWRRHSSEVEETLMPEAETERCKAHGCWRRKAREGRSTHFFF
ncbi:hypothetical protein HA466_0205000 [Hirschfeldia incana]|nr:hypothetical protein HA466_0205000 [Hirschfeldia incana]